MNELTDKTIDSATTSGVTVIDFYAEWCPPCKALAPIFEKASGSFSNASFVKMDAESNPETVTKYNISGLPTIVVLKDGKLVDKHRGLIGQKQLEELVQKHI